MTTFEDNNTVIVIDNGGYTTKSGFAGIDAPQSIVDTAVLYKFGHGRRGDHNYIQGDSNTNQIETNKTRTFIHPIEHGLIVDFNNMEKIWHHIFEKELRTKPNENDIILTESAFNTKK
eukprot:158302_1